MVGPGFEDRGLVCLPLKVAYGSGVTKEWVVAACHSRASGALQRQKKVAPLLTWPQNPSRSTGIVFPGDQV